MYGSADDISEGEALSEWLECEDMDDDYYEGDAYYDDTSKPAKSQREKLTEMKIPELVQRIHKLEQTVETLVEILQAQGTELPKKKVVYLKETPKVGDRIECKHCGKVFIKKSYQHKFCSLRCKDTFHNSHGDRAFRARWWNS
jgi:hypothetical protein